MRSLALTVVVAVLITMAPGPAGAAYECGGEFDTCNCGGDNFCLCDGTCGNCVWHAWHMACCEWGRALEWCTDAGTWDQFAPDNGYPMGSDPHNKSIFVCNPSATCSQWGHVGWVVTAYPDGSFDSTEQFWGGPCGTHDRHREAGFATAGFIYDPDNSEIDDAEFVSENVPDGTEFVPGQAFTKRWTLRNTGTSTWTRAGNYLLAHDGDETFSAEDQTLLAEGVEIAPGETHDWEVDMVAPASAGVYRGYWRMNNNGVGRFGDRIWVEIVVVGEEIDAGHDAGYDAGHDAGTDAGHDAGYDAGPGDSGTADAQADGGAGADEDGQDPGGGCSCSSSKRTGQSAGFSLLLLAAVLFGRRRRSGSGR